VDHAREIEHTGIDDDRRTLRTEVDRRLANTFRPLQPPLDSRRTRGTRHPAHGDRVPDPRARRVGAGRCALRRGRDRAATLRDGLHDPGAPGPRAATRTTLDIHHPDLPGSGTSTRMLVHEVEDLLVR